MRIAKMSEAGASRLWLAVRKFIRRKALISMAPQIRGKNNQLPPTRLQHRPIFNTSIKDVPEI
jgi:hypothetical protein